MNETYQCKSPVLFLVFNRPDVTYRVFEAIRKAKPPRLYIAADGPRPERPSEVKLCNEARHIASEVDWDCEVKTLFRNKNLGCAVAVSEAINWLFECEEEGIILEDDILVHPTWFRFVDEMLERYRDSPKVMCVTALGYNYPATSDTSYTFSLYNHCWGWATWRRAWNSYDHAMAKWPRLRTTNWLRVLGGSRLFASYWGSIFDRVKAEEINSWAYRWTFSVWHANGLSVHPSINMMENLGFGCDATHTNREADVEWNAKPLSFPLVHPNEIQRNEKYDRYVGQNHFRLTKTKGLLADLRLLGLLRKMKNLLK